MAHELDKDVLQRLARLGAQARLEQLEEEHRAILRAFPGLAANIARQKSAAAAEPAAPAKVGKARKRRRKMTAAEKKAASERMKQYWAEKKKSGK